VAVALVFDPPPQAVSVSDVARPMPRIMRNLVRRLG
jgi:hypothetical protein